MSLLTSVRKYSSATGPAFLTFGYFEQPLMCSPGLLARRPLNSTHFRLLNSPLHCGLAKIGNGGRSLPLWRIAVLVRESPFSSLWDGLFVCQPRGAELQELRKVTKPVHLDPCIFQCAAMKAKIFEKQPVILREP